MTVQLLVTIQDVGLCELMTPKGSQLGPQEHEMQDLCRVAQNIATI